MKKYNRGKEDPPTGEPTPVSIPQSELNRAKSRTSLLTAILSSGATQAEAPSLAILSLSTSLAAFLTGLLVALLLLFSIAPGNYWILLILSLATCCLGGVSLLANYRVQSALTRARKSSLSQETDLKRAFAEIEKKRQSGQAVSHEINSLTSELQSLSHQLAGGSGQQLASLTQVISFLSELAATAKSIETLSDTIKQAAQRVLSLSENVLKTSYLVTETGERGQQSVELTIENNSEVNRLFNAFLEMLEKLRQQSRKISGIITQSKELSEETHLLALNAAIEAAGAGEYGDRFGVVAQEVNSLANRSRQASTEAEGILLEVEASIKEAVGVAGEVHAQTEQAVNVANNTGEVINELTRIISQITLQAGGIRQAASRVSNLLEEISLTTSQQHNATGQAVTALQEIEKAAQLTASSSSQVNLTTQGLEELSLQLLKVLATESVPPSKKL
jgi:methyl-accepting chemotaxis protein